MTIAWINFGLVQRSLRETWATTLIFALLVGGFSALLAYVLPGVQERFLQRNFIPPQLLQIRNALLGVDGATTSVAQFAFGLAWAHPVVMTLVFAHAVMLVTRVPAGEVERGTMDVLLGLPVSRWTLHVSESAAWVISGAVLLGSMFAGSYLGAQFIKPANRPEWDGILIVLVNLAGVYFVAGTAGLLAATCTNRRGRAVLWVLIFIVGSMLLFLLRSLWEPADKFGFLSLMHYYRPAVILRAGEWPVRDLIVLGSGMAVLWVLSGVILSRRALTTT
jgi:ABC-2 type transport system permease protein